MKFHASRSTYLHCDVLGESRDTHLQPQGGKIHATRAKIQTRCKCNKSNVYLQYKVTFPDILNFLVLINQNYSAFICYIYYLYSIACCALCYMAPYLFSKLINITLYVR